MKNPTLLAAVVVCAVSIIFLIYGCSGKPEYETIDNQWFSCELVSNWTKPDVIDDGEIFQLPQERLWQRNSPKYKGWYGISIRHYEGSAKIILKMYKQYPTLNFSPDNESFFVKYPLGGSLKKDFQDGWIIESWGFLKGNDLTEVSYQYPKDGSERIREEYRRIVDVTLKSMQIK